MSRKKLLILLAPLCFLILASISWGCGDSKAEATAEQLSYLDKADDFLAGVDSYRTRGTLDIEIEYKGESYPPMGAKMEGEMVRTGDGHNGKLSIDFSGSFETLLDEARTHYDTFLVDDLEYTRTNDGRWFYTDYRESLNVFGMSNIENIQLIDPDMMSTYMENTESIEVVREDTESIQLAFDVKQELYHQAFRDYVAQIIEGSDLASEEDKAEFLEKIMERALDSMSMRQIFTIRKEDGMITNLITYVSFIVAPTAMDVAKTRVFIDNDIFDYNEDIFIELPAEAETATYYEPGTPIPLEDE